MTIDNAFFITGTAYAGKSTIVRLLAEKYDGILCEENYHDQLLKDLDPDEFLCLCYTRDLEDCQCIYLRMLTENSKRD